MDIRDLGEGYVALLLIKILWCPSRGLMPGPRVRLRIHPPPQRRLSKALLSLPTHNGSISPNVSYNIGCTRTTRGLRAPTDAVAPIPTARGDTMPVPCAARPRVALKTHNVTAAIKRPAARAICILKYFKFLQIYIEIYKRAICSGEAITPHTIVVDAMSMSFETGQIVDRLGYIKASEVYEVVVNEDLARVYQVLNVFSNVKVKTKKAELEESKQRAHKEKSEFQGRIRVFLKALRRAAKSLPGATSLQGTSISEAKRKKLKVSINPKPRQQGPKKGKSAHRLQSLEGNHETTKRTRSRSS
ncbi:hypothetical protein EVAR_16981_1 [Eumeta japonica]|uniref:Uncharacterized protein n=1 Tax=Eumeta variegata TaxID=151549 RepID=A0A4C1TVH7_EUMVA|nr:hypothetical protein EVAR_16981_1 [Eumeta japonica]